MGPKAGPVQNWEGAHVTIGFLGLGEAGSAMAAGLRAQGVDGVVAYDRAWQESELVRIRAAECGVELVASPEELACRAEVIISSVVGAVARSAAASIAEHLGEGHWYLDINSVSPGVKEAIAQDLAPRGVSFVDIAVMAAVTSDLPALPLLAAGEWATEVAARFPGVELDLTPVSERPGDAARIKMFRSLFIKGLEALALEALMACYPAGVHEQVLATLDETFARRSFSDFVRRMVQRHAVHGERRAHELVEVADSLREVEIDPIMAQAAFERMSWSIERGLQKGFQDGHTPDWRTVLDELEELRAGEVHDTV